MAGFCDRLRSRLAEQVSHENEPSGSLRWVLLTAKHKLTPLKTLNGFALRGGLYFEAAPLFSHRNRPSESVGGGDGFGGCWPLNLVGGVIFRDPFFGYDLVGDPLLQ